MASIDTLVDEILVLIFSFLGNIDKLKAACVSKRWNELIEVTGTSLDLRGISYSDIADGRNNRYLRQSIKVLTLDHDSSSPKRFVNMLNLIREKFRQVRAFNYYLACNGHGYRRLAEVSFKAAPWSLYLLDNLTRVTVQCTSYPTFDDLGYCRGGYYYKYMRLTRLRDSTTSQIDDDDGRCQLKVLELCGVRLTVDSFQNVNISHALKHLQLQRPVFAPSGEFIACLRYFVTKYRHLRSLVISWPVVISGMGVNEDLDEFIELLGSSVNDLKKLVLRGLKGPLKEASMERFTRRADHLEILHCEDCSFINDVNFECISRNLSRLKNLSVSVANKAQVTDAGLAALCSHANIERLDISGQYRISADAIVDVVSTLPRLRELVLDHSLRMNKQIKSLHCSRNIALTFLYTKSAFFI